ncbi:unnamed protein product [Arabidopsis thaliana]|uniref:(thale cress) hypothetical protein n=1 Tax=Arabidopsis thaliana TaxID=3702 RepID=A0A7G2DS40_ARATH|nr:unnamed protein product [Arabidopsis thaliana]
MAYPERSLIVDPRSGFCKSNSTFYSKRQPLSLPPNLSLDVTTFISSQPHRGKTAFIDAATGQCLTFSDLWRAVDRVADCLYHEVGIRRGDVVLILSPNSIFIPVVCLSVMSLGAVFTTANTLNTSGEISKQIADSNPTLVFTTRQLAPKLPVAISVVLTDDEVYQELTSAIRVVGILSEMVKKEPSGQRVRDRVNQDDTAMMLYSSGTTGPSKGVISSHRNLTAHVARFISDNLKRDDIFICTVPMFHTYGLLTFAMGTVALGSTVVILRRFQLHDMMDAVEKHRATALALAPPVLVAMINDADLIKAKYDLSSLKTVRCGGAPLSKEVTEGFLEKYPTVDILQGYALTESNGGGAFTNSAEESRRYGTAGTLTSDVEARIVDPNTGRFMGINQTGELWLKGPSISKGYFKNQEATNETINLEGWLKTGDLCYIDEDGFLFVVDRLKELIKYKGYQVPPAELEALLITHPDILDAAVIPFPDKEAGQYPMAYVVRKHESNLSKKKVIDFISKQGLCTVPMFHSFGLLAFAMGSVASGSTVVILRRFGLDDMMQAVEKYKATILSLAPPVLVAMINGADQLKAKYDLTSLRKVRCGGAPLSKEVMDSFLEKYPTVNIFQGYALTESHGSGASTESVEESLKYGAVGLLSSGIEARIVDPDTGRVMGVNQPGELWLKGPSISKGYFGNEEATNETINLEGWLKTGDLCYIDEDGFLFVVDRLKELIKYKGYQVPPAELEALLIAHPHILDAAVIPFPDREAGQ